MEKTKDIISVLELRRLLITIADYNLPICFRFRILGDMWKTHFMRIVKVTEKGVVLNEESSNRLIVIADLSLVMQFELDGRIHGYEPNYHYGITIQEVLS
jgi:hypothetical protein